MTMPISVDLAASLISLILKSTLILGLAGLLALVVMKRSGAAASRHLIWVFAMGALLILPALEWVLPQWQPRAFGLPAQLGATPAVEDVLLQSVVEEGKLPGTPGGAGTVQGTSARAATTAGEVITSGPDMKSVVLSIYFLVTALLLFRVSIGRWSVRVLSRDAARVDDDRWTKLLRDLTSTLGISRPVALLMSAQSVMPVTWGTRRPTILLPADANRWSDDQRRMVLLHELSHVKRLDCLTQTLATVTCALYWLHPAVWYAARRLRLEREIACDDHVLRAGERPSAYASILLEATRAFRTPALNSPVAINMASLSQVEVRIGAILDRVRRRNGVSGGNFAFAVALSLGLLLPLAAFQPVGAAATPDTGTIRPVLHAEPPSQSVSPVAPLDVAEPPAVPTLDSRLSAPRDATLSGQSQVVVKSVATRPGERLTIDLATGGELTVIGWNQDSISLRAELRGASHQETRIDLVAAPGGALLTTRASDATGDAKSYRFELRVPSNQNLQIASAGGGISISDIEGSIEGHTTSGTVLIERVRGTARMMAGRGQFRVRDSTLLDGELRTAKGTVWRGNMTGSIVSAPWTDSGEENSHK